MNILRFFSRIIVGIVFLFSGFVKAIDPLGSAYKFDDYFTAFGMEWLQFISLPLSFFLSGAEFLIGVSLFLGVRLKAGSWASTVFMVFFTILTFFLAIFNPVTDCGCFGDALILTNWQTFYKNLIIIIPTLYIFTSIKKYPGLLQPIYEWLTLVVFGILILGISGYGFRHLPIFDFRPYKTGVFIPEQIEFPDNAPVDEYESILVYEKNGVQQKFTDKNYPWEDSTWTFVDAQHILIKKGYEPPIHDFTIETQDGDDISDLVLYDESFTFLFIAYDINKTKTKNIEKLNDLANYSINFGYRFIGLTSSLNDEIEQYKNQNNLVFEFYNTDETALKTIIRSNPGLLLLKDGVILNKWHFNDVPDVDEIGENLVSFSITSLENDANKLKLNNVLWIGLTLVLIFLIIVNLSNKKKINRSPLKE